MKIDYVAVGKRIKKARKACGITQEKLAELTGMSTAHIGKVEVATNEPSLQALVDIADEKGWQNSRIKKHGDL